MKICFNGLEDPSLPPVLAGVLREAYEAAVNRAALAGLTILDLRLDGKVIPSDNRARLFERPVTSFAEMDLEAVNTRQLVRAAVAEVRNHLEPCRQALQSAHSLLAAGHEVLALKTLKPSLEVWMAVCEAVTKAAILIGTDLSAPLVDGCSIEDAQRSIVAVLDQTRSIVGSRDWPALSDLIQSQFLPLVTRWEQICRLLESEPPPQATQV